MKIRQGRKNPHTLYLQAGEEPSDDDVSIGYIRFPSMAPEIVRRFNAGPSKRDEKK